jgi:hypothetical protein
MKTSFRMLAIAAVTTLTLSGCMKKNDGVSDTTAMLDSASALRADSALIDSLRNDSLMRADSIRLDSARRADSVRINDTTPVPKRKP